MSSNSPSLLRSPFSVTPTMRITLFAWGIVMIGAFLLHSINSANTTALRDDVIKTQEGLANLKTEHEAGSPELQSELNQARMESSLVSERIARLESALGGESSIADRSSLTQSELAVRKADAAKHTAIANAAVRDLGKLKNLQTEWAAIEGTLMNGQAGNRIAGSAKHLSTFVDIQQRQRPTAEQMVDWEAELNPLTEPFTQGAPESIMISITDEHGRRLSDLGKELKTQAAEFERQKLLLESIQRETSALPSGSIGLATALQDHSTKSKRAEAERLEQARSTARAAAEKEQVDQIARAERQLSDEKTKQVLGKIASEKQVQAEEARVEELKRKAKIEGLKDDANRIQDAVQEALLEGQLARDMNEIKGLLAAFVSPGFKHRNDGKKGPASYSLLKARRVLENTQTGLTALLWFGCADNDRPHDALPYYIGGNVNWNETNAKPIERAQELLNKYGELMVKKGLLAE